MLGRRHRLARELARDNAFCAIANVLFLVGVCVRFVAFIEEKTFSGLGDVMFFWEHTHLQEKEEEEEEEEDEEQRYVASTGRSLSKLKYIDGSCYG